MVRYWGFVTLFILLAFHRDLVKPVTVQTSPFQSFDLSLTVIFLHDGVKARLLRPVIHGKILHPRRYL